MNNFLPNTAGLGEYSTEELLLELSRRAMIQRVKQDAINCLYDDYLLGRLKSEDIINRMYDASKVV